MKETGSSHGKSLCTPPNGVAQGIARDFPALNSPRFFGKSFRKQEEFNSMETKKNFSVEEAKQIGEQLGIDWSKFDVNQFRRGMDVELEHGLRDLHTNVTNDDSLMTGKIALAHLNEFPDYYDRLDVMEHEADEFWGKEN